MRPLRLVAALVVAAGLPAGAARACDSNGCFQMTRGEGLLRKGQWRVDLSFRTTDQSSRRSGTAPTDSVRRPKVWLEGGYMWPGFHEELDGRERFLQLEVAYGLFARTSLFATAPLRAARSYTVGHGGLTQEYLPTGYGDTLLGVRQSLARNLVATAGVKIATGSNDIIDDYDGTILDPMLQPGTGAVDLFGSLGYSFGALHPSLRWTAAVSRQQTTANEYEYQFGSETIAALGVRRALRGPVDLAVQAKLFDKGRSTFLGEDVASTGARYLYVTPGVHVRLPSAMAAYVLLPLPVYRDVNEAQLAPRIGVVVGMAKTF
jgi:hypothetical protein